MGVGHRGKSGFCRGFANGIWISTLVNIDVYVAQR